MRSTVIIFLLATVFFAAAAPAPSNSTSTSMLKKRVDHWGQATWFEVGLGNCGEWNSDSDSIVALPTGMYGSGGNCNQWVHVTDTDIGANAWGMVRDSCPGCAWGSLDMSPGLFSQMADLSQGVFPIEWHFEA